MHGRGTRPTQRQNSAIRKLTDGKAPGYDNITAEELKATGNSGVDIVHHLCNKIWESEKLPDDWEKPLLLQFTRKRAN